MTAGFSLKDYLRGIPFPFCAGCGGTTVASSFLRAVYDLGYSNLEGFVFCSGIGCASWIPSPHFNADSIHTTHGRSIAVATGVKLTRPDLNVVVFGGDGDIVGIGLSHLIHAARRNLDVTVIMVNNMIYGMTGGQVAATTPLNIKTATTPYGGFEPPINSVSIVASAGASYASRWTTAHQPQLVKAIRDALEVKGFSFVEVVSQCPTAYGRRAGFKSAGEMVKWLRAQSVKIGEAGGLTEEKRREKIVVGEFVKRTRPTLSDRLRLVQERAQG